jgi:hypothetical protein
MKLNRFFIAFWFSYLVFLVWLILYAVPWLVERIVRIP